MNKKALMKVRPLASRLAAVLALLPDFGDDLFAVEVRAGHDQNPSFRSFADVAIRVYADGDRCETLGAEILDRFPNARLYRDDGTFSIVQSGDLSWSVYFSESACSRVQVGTRTKTIPDPEALESVPLIEVEEPVYEWRCADPLADTTMRSLLEVSA